MTPQELDEVCCRLAGLPPNWRHDYECEAVLANDRHMFSQRDVAGCDCEPVAEYPPVSQDWGSAGRLMDALASRVWVRLSLHGGGVTSKYSCGVGMLFTNKYAAGSVAESGPMALALAVAELAKQSLSPATMTGRETPWKDSGIYPGYESRINPEGYLENRPKEPPALPPDGIEPKPETATEANN